MKVGDKVTFEVMDAVENPPTMDDNEAINIAFVPFESFQWCRYYNGSKTWRSMVTMKTVKPTSWLRKLEDDNRKNKRNT